MAPPKQPPRRGRKPPPKRGAEPTGRPTPKQWGSVARKGARSLEEDEATASAVWREAMKAARRGRHDDAPAEPSPADLWIDEGPARPANRRQPRRRPSPAPAPAPARKGGGDRRAAQLPTAVEDELTTAARAGRVPRLRERLADATRAYERDRYPDARRILRHLADEAPGAAAVRELYGLTLYRLGRYPDAIRELRAFHNLTGSFDQHPTMADCQRALRRYRAAEQSWQELRQASPGPELLAEGRLVAAGARADQGDARGAIAILEPALAGVKRPKLHHLRQWYALADLYERAGELPRARDLFRRILRHDAHFFDTGERARALG